MDSILKIVHTALVLLLLYYLIDLNFDSCTYIYTSFDFKPFLHRFYVQKCCIVIRLVNQGCIKSFGATLLYTVVRNTVDYIHIQSASETVFGLINSGDKNL